MNDKIKELAKRAGFYFYDMHDVDGQDLGETIEADSWSVAENFAELIVRDCIEIVEASKAGFSQVPAEVALDLTAKNIKAYFGLK